MPHSDTFERLARDHYVGIDDEGNVAYGYDQTVPVANAGIEDDPFDPPMSRDEKLMLADEMLARWQRYRANVMRRG